MLKKLFVLMLLGGVIVAGFMVFPSIPAGCLPHRNQGYSLRSCIDQLRGISSPNDVRTAAFPGVVDIEISRGFLCLDHSHGTGFIMNANGLIGTAKHIVASFGTICGWSVTLNDGRTLSGKVTWRHSTADVATIQLDKANNIKPVSIGSSSAARIGDPVYTASYPGGANNPPVLSTGTLIGRGQCNEVSDGLWFDADVLPGYSGGPLLDSAGRVIGVVTGSSSAFKKGSGSCAVPIEYLTH